MYARISFFDKSYTYCVMKKIERFAKNVKISYNNIKNVERLCHTKYGTEFLRL